MRKALLDEGVPRALADILTGRGIAAQPFPNEWKGIKNGVLLARAEAAGFDVLVTSDQSIYAQQDFRGRKISVVILPSNRLATVLAMADNVAGAIELSKAGA